MNNKINHVAPVSNQTYETSENDYNMTSTPIPILKTDLQFGLQKQS
jgi:hypothetical protein